MNQTLHGNIFTPHGWQHGQVTFDTHLRVIDATASDPTSNSAEYILPGFIDLHIHGGGGRDVMEGGNALATITHLHARHGTTSLLATTMTAPHHEITHALQGVQQAMQQRNSGGARVLGVHLDGGFISAKKLGAQPNYTRNEDTDSLLAEVLAFDAIAPIKVLTLAPEVAHHMDLVAALTQRGIRVQLGHTQGSYEDGVAALTHGAVSFTHLFNAMSPLHQRAPGMVGAALAHAEYAELIPDLLHVHPGAIRAALRAIPKLYCVTDSTAAAGMPDGDYKLGQHTVHKCLGGVRLADGTLAGSTLTLDQALRNLVSMGLALNDAVQRLATYPAALLGLADRGQLALGSYADIVVFDRQLQLKAVYVEGEQVLLNE